MPSVLKRGGVWFLKYRDATGEAVRVRSEARTKTEAQRLADDLERRFERQRMGLAPLETEAGESVSAMLTWWLKDRPRGPRSTDHHLVKPILADELGAMPVGVVRAPDVERFLARQEARGLKPQTINHLRSALSRAYSRARKMGRFVGANPVEGVTRRKVVVAVPSFLQAHEVAPLLRALGQRWSPIFATAIFTGLRRGELLSLEKSDVDLDRGLLAVRRSHERQVTKGGRHDVIPLADEVTPYLRVAVERSPSKLVFPGEDGKPMRHDAKLQSVLRRALARAGIVEGWLHTCRRCKAKGEVHEERHADSDERRCPRCSMKLWPKAIHRKLRFHDLRHTTASLMTMAGASPASVQKILRHSSLQVTQRYQHLAPGFLRGEVNRLRLLGDPLARSNGGPNLEEGSPEALEVVGIP